MRKLLLEGLDCAHCAARIESELRKHEGLELATVNFVTKTLALDVGSEELARSIITRVEPAIEIVAPEERAEKGAARRDAWPIVKIIVSGALFLAGILFEKQLSVALGGFAQFAVFLPAYVLVGFPVLKTALNDMLRGKLFNEMFLMAVATIGAILLGELSEAVGVMLFFSIGEYLQDRAIESSRKSIEGLLGLRPEFARVVSPRRAGIMEPEAVLVGDMVEVRPGEKIPLDGIVEEGDSFVNTASLTGESVPRAVGPGGEVKAGFVNESSRIVIRVSALFGTSSVARILELVENAAAQKAPTERFMTKVAAVYTPFVVISALALAFLPPLFVPGQAFGVWAYRALVMLVISCPCALVISIPLGYFGGIGSASRHRILLKGANHLDTLRKLDTIVFDKTGTLTEGRFEVTAIEGPDGKALEEESALKLIRFAAAAEKFSSHPIARALRNKAGSGCPVPAEAVELKGLGVTARVEGRRVLAGNLALFEREGVPVEFSGRSGTIVHVAVDGAYSGRIIVSDTIKPEAYLTIAELKSAGVRRILMLTGDRNEAAAEVAGKLGIDGFHAELLPEEKVARLGDIMESTHAGGKVAFVGDGMNDAPVLMRSDLGIAMGAIGSDAAIQAADAVIMDDRISRISGAVKIAAFTRRVVIQNIIFALGIKSVFLMLGAAGQASMWEAVIADVGVALLAVLNSIRTVRYSPAAHR